MADSPQTVEAAFLAYRTTRDPAALAAVYDGTASRLLAVALHLASSANLAEDAVQDTFLIALEHPERWDETRPLVPWLMGILVNRVRQSAHRQSRMPDPDRLLAPDVRDPESELEANELLASIDDAITRLAQPYRAVVLLRLRNGLSPADIAVALDRKPSTVRAQLARGIEMLRKVLPAGAAALFAHSLTAARGTSAAREVVLARATEIHAGLLSAQRAANLRGWSVGLGAVLAVAAATWFAIARLGGAALPPQVVAEVPEEIEDVAPVVHEQPYELPAREASSARRVDAAPTGALEIVVERPSVRMPDAEVELEPLGDPPRAFVHDTALPGRSWRSIVPAIDNPPERLRHARTGPDGVASFEGLRPGFWVVRALGVDAVAEVRDGAIGRVAIRAAPGSRLVRGLVVDADGRALAGARVWTTLRHRRFERRDATTTDAAGRFDLTVGPHTVVGVSYPGRAPVAVAIVARDEGPPVEQVFELREAGARLSGRVVDGEGRPLRGMHVRVGHPRDAHARPMPATPEPHPAPEVVRTDAEGRFSFDSLLGGEALLSASGEGFGVSRRAVAIAAGGASEVEVVLARAAAISGRVFGESGAPLAGVSVRVGRRGDQEHRSTVTDEAGRYVVDGVSPGAPVVRFVGFAGGFAVRSVACAAGENVTCDVTLSSQDLLLRGRVLDARGRPFVGGWVVYMAPSGVCVAALDADGRYAIPVSERDATTVSPVMVFDHDPRDAAGRVFGMPRLVVRDQQPELGERELVVPDLAERASVRGRVLQADGTPPSHGVVLRAGDEVASWRLRLDPSGARGAFEARGLPPGRYVVIAEGGHNRLAEFELAAGEQRELGVLTIGDDNRCAAVQLAPVFPAGEATGDLLSLVVHDERGRLVLTRTRACADGLHSDPRLQLPRGRYRLTASTSSGLAASRDLVVGEAAPRALPLVFGRR